MTSRDFCYWLQGFFELTHPNGGMLTLDANTVKQIRNHLNMVFKHEIDPSHGDAAHQKILSDEHAGGAAGKSPKPTRTRTRQEKTFSAVDWKPITEVNC